MIIKNMHRSQRYESGMGKLWFTYIKEVVVKEEWKCPVKRGDGQRERE